MTINVIDTMFHGSSFPPSYTGPGTLIGNVRNAASVINQTCGNYTSNGNATQINLGFRPTYIRFFNLTDDISWEWMSGFGATQSIKTVGAGTMTVDTGSAFTLTDGGSGNWTLTTSTTLEGTAKALVFSIEG
jgi:hypothetical protein